jgi:hypothetical protein
MDDNEIQMHDIDEALRILNDRKKIIRNDNSKTVELKGINDQIRDLNIQLNHYIDLDAKKNPSKYNMYDGGNGGIKRKVVKRKVIPTKASRPVKPTARKPTKPTTRKPTKPTTRKPTKPTARKPTKPIARKPTIVRRK